MYTLLIFFINRSFLDIEKKNKKPGFKKRESPSRFRILILNGAQNFKFISFIYATLIGWILYTFQPSGYNKYKIRLVSILRKRDDQALISISAIQLRLDNRSGLGISHLKIPSSELKTSEWGILNPDRLI